MRRWKLPVGIENFQEIRQAGFYYVDKTRLIEQLLEQWGKFPVLFLSLKNVDGLTFEDARYHLTELVGREAFLGRRSVFLIKKHEMVRLLRSDPNWLVQSNVESGDGFADILVEPEDPDAGIIIELKYVQTFAGLEKACERAMNQI